MGILEIDHGTRRRLGGDAPRGTRGCSGDASRGTRDSLPFVTPDFDPGSSLDARVRGHDDRQSRPGVTVLLKTRCHLFESE